MLFEARQDRYRVATMRSLFFQALLAFLALPGIVAYLVPLLMIDGRADQPVNWAGLAIVATGSSLLLWCVREFYVSGKGALAPWKRTGLLGSFVQLVGAGRTCGGYVCEIPPGGESKPQRYIFEQLIYVLKGHGATTVWNQGTKKQTFEWQEGSLFSPPLNAWHQHFNVTGSETARYVALTDAPQMINRFRNLDFIFGNDFSFMDRFSGEDGYYSGKGREVATYRTWESNFIPDIRDFKLKDRSLRGQGATGIRLHLAANTMSAHLEQYPSGTYPKAHRHGPGAHIVILSGRRVFFPLGRRAAAHPHRLASGKFVRAAGISRSRMAWRRAAIAGIVTKIVETAAPIAGSPATPAPRMNTCAGFTRPAAVICPGKKRPKCAAASMTAR